MPDNVEEMMNRLTVVRDQLDAHDRTKMRLEGELEGHTSRSKEIQKTCKDKFDCGIDDLPEMAEDLETKAEAAIVEAENILGVSQSN